ncbi:MAG: type II secretion system inner membrane protein GspF [Burkholderiaceae bacterium]|nr:type II secretion system inner membrane protein GspF [Burkholderiaceae bacterium]
MPAYRFEASDAAGRVERGVIDADSPRQARTQLRGRGLTPLEISAVGGANEQGVAFGSRIRTVELTLVTRQLASLLAARLPLEQALGAVIEQADRPALRERLSAVRAEVVAGQNFAQALARYPRDFPEVYRALVSAGEQSGDLALVMERLADYIESRNALVQRVTLAFTYPAIVTLVAIGVIVALLAYVVPQVVGVFAQTRQELPALTVGLIALSGFVRDWGWWVLALAVALLFAFRAALRSPAFRIAWHERLLRLPLAGRLIRGMNTARFASTLGILAASGVPLIRSLEAGAQTLTNEAMRANVADAIARVREGASLSRSLAAGGQFPPMMVHMIASGEATGELAPMLERTAATLSGETERRALALTGVLEPALILVMGAVVLLIVLAVLLPIIEINQLVR